jgi:hypothetical protein
VPPSPMFNEYLSASSPMPTGPLYSGYSDAAYAFDYFSNAHGRPPRPAAPAPVATSMPVAGSNPMMYILFRHNNALLAVMQSPLQPEPAEYMEPAKRLAVSTLAQLGWSWPDLLDRPYPGVVPGEAGAKYERTFVKYVVLSLISYISLNTFSAAAKNTCLSLPRTQHLPPGSGTH